jgi:hypothetical protein
MKEGSMGRAEHTFEQARRIKVPGTIEIPSFRRKGCKLHLSFYRFRPEHEHNLRLQEVVVKKDTQKWFFTTGQVVQYTNK